MQLFPNLQLGWLNGWVLLTIWYAVFALLLLLFPRPVVARLAARSHWSSQQKIGAAIGKLFAVASLILLVLTPLKIGSWLYYCGVSLFSLGLYGFASALFHYKNTPPNRPVVTGIYQYSRNPQLFMIAVMVVGVCLATGSGVALILLLIAQIFQYQFTIRAEEQACLTQYGRSYQEYMEAVPRYFVIF